MLIQEPDPILESMVLLGDKNVCMYLLMSERYPFLSGSMSYVIPKENQTFSIMKQK